jgi:hypothetical protein
VTKHFRPYSFQIKPVYIYTQTTHVRVRIWIWILVFIVTFSNISAISWRPVLVVEEAGVPGVIYTCMHIFMFVCNSVSVLFIICIILFPYCITYVSQDVRICFVFCFFFKILLGYCGFPTTNIYNVKFYRRFYYVSNLVYIELSVICEIYFTA